MSKHTIWRVCIALTMLTFALTGIGTALAAPAHAPARQSGAVLPGIYVSEAMTADDGTAYNISVILLGDGSAAMVFATADESETAVGAWEEDDGAVTVTLTGTETETFDEPVVTTFEVEGDVLTAVEYDETIFGADGFSVTLSVSEEELAAAEDQGLADEGSSSPAPVGGIYSSDVVDLGAPSVWLLNLNEDGTFQAGAVIFDGETDLSSVTGTWVAGEDGTLTLTSEQELYATEDGGTDVGESDQEEPLVLTVGADGTLSAAEEATGGVPLVFYPHQPSVAAHAQAEATDAVGVRIFVSDILPAADTPGRVISLALADDGGAALATSYLNDEPAVVEDGYWVENDDGTLTVTLVGNEDEEYAEPTVITFELADDTLTAVDYDETLYGEAELTLTLVPDEGQTAPDPLDIPSGGGAAESDAEAAAPGALEGAAEAAPGDLEMVPAAFAEAFALEEGIDAGILVYQSDVLPAADTSGRQITLALSDDGAAEMSTDYLNDEPPIVEIGAWAGSGDETITVTLTGREDLEYDEPTVIVFAVEGDTLTAIDYDEALYGSEGLTLTLASE